MRQLADSGGHINTVLRCAVGGLQDVFMVRVCHALAQAARPPAGGGCAPAPAAATPAPELCAVHPAVFAVIKMALLAIGPQGQDAQRLALAGCRVGVEQVVGELKALVAGGQLAQAVGHVDAILVSAVDRLQDLVWAFVALGPGGGRQQRQHQGSHQQQPAAEGSGDGGGDASVHAGLVEGERGGAERLVVSDAAAHGTGM